MQPNRTPSDLPAAAQRVLDLRLACAALSTTGLTDLEFLTLCLLQARGTMMLHAVRAALGVEDVQQGSRLVRALEQRRDPPLIEAKINRHDRRHLDLALTEAGAVAVQKALDALKGESLCLCQA